MPDFEQIYNEAQPKAMSGGKKRFYDNKVTAIETMEKEGKLTVAASVLGEDKTYAVEIVFDEQGGLYDYMCDCNNFSLNEGPCKHIVAAALTFEEKNPVARQVMSSPVKARTDAAALSLITEYSKRKHRSVSDGDFKVELIPIVVYDGGGISLKFSLGRKRKYTLKDISDFVSVMNVGGYRRYGAELGFIHNYNNFTPASASLAAFVCKAYKERAELSTPSNSREEIKLLQSDVDSFLESVSGQVILFSDRNISSGVRLVIKEPNAIGASLNIQRVQNGFVLTFPIGDFYTVLGRNYTYLITDSKIIKCTEDFMRAVSPYLKANEYAKKIYVSEEDMPGVYNNIIVSLADYITINSDADLTVFEAPPLNVKIYLDADDNGINAKTEATYDDVEIDLKSEDYYGAILRDWESENGLRELLKKYFVNYPDLNINNESDAYRFVSEGVASLQTYAEIFASEDFKKIKVKRNPRIRVGVRLNGDLIDVNLDSEDLSSAELIKVLQAYRDNKAYVRLSGGLFVDLADPSLGAVSEIFAVAGVQEDKLTLPKYYAPYLNDELKNGFFILERSAEFKSLIKSLSDTPDSDIEVPKSLSDIMRNYQKAGFRWLKTLCHYNFGGILADDMGLGKSLQIIALLKAHGKGVSIIVCPTTLMLNWVNEFNKFAPEIKVRAVMGNFDERKELTQSFDDCDVIITSYELMRRDEKFYADTRFEFAVIDEAQYIKNPDTMSAKSVKTLKSAYRFALTGTPIENSLAELWSIFDFIMPGYLNTYPHFRDNYELGIVRGEAQAAARLQKLVAPFILRRLKSGVLTELPDKVETEIITSLEDEQKKLYDFNLDIIKESLRNPDQTNKVVILSQLTKLRQICCAPELILPDYKGNCSKLDTCLELIDNAIVNNHKVLVFSQFTSMLDILRVKLVTSGITHYMLKGDTPKVERMRLVKSFNEDDTKVFLISLKAGGTGLNLTGADVVIHYDPWWNESVMNQATDRAYRIGQKRSVQVYKLIMGGTIEEKIMKLQQKKTALSNLLVGKNFDLNEILQLL